jgi:hypothetical protein
MPEKEDTHEELLRLTRENSVLIKENNEILRKLRRYSIIGFVARVLWYSVLVGLPFALYHYVLDPYFAATGADYEVFRQGILEIPGLKGLENIMPSFID